MQPLTAPGPSSTSAGRLTWRLIGIVTIVAVIVPATFAIVFRAGVHPGESVTTATPVHTVTVPGTVSHLSVTSYGAPIKVVRKPVRRVAVAEEVIYDAGTKPPRVETDVSAHSLTLAAPACANGDCAVGFTVTLPLTVTVNATSEGGDITVIGGAAAATLDSGGGKVTAREVRGPLAITSEGGDVTLAGTGQVRLDSGGGAVTARQIHGPLTFHTEGGSVSLTGAQTVTLDTGGGTVVAQQLGGPLNAHTEGGPLQLAGLSGTLTADTGGGPVTATAVSAPASLVNTEGGTVSLGFGTAPRQVQVDTGGGPALIELPGGPYAVSAESSGAPAGVSVPTSSGASRTVVVRTEGGPLQITPEPAG